jgi:hypothetical protein
MVVSRGCICLSGGGWGDVASITFNNVREWGGLHGIETLSGIKSLLHGYIAFSIWLTIADIDMDIIEIYHTYPPQFPHVF